MPFIGKQPTAGFASIVKDDLTADGSTTAFTLSKQVANANDIAVFVGNVRQEPTDAYTVSGTTLTMSAAPASAINFYVLHIAGTVESSVVPADNTISTAKLQPNAVTTAKLSDSAITTGKLPAGSILQVESTTKVNAFSSTSSSFVDIPGMAISITPTRSDSKILIRISLNYGGANNVYPAWLVQRNIGGGSYSNVTISTAAPSSGTQTSFATGGDNDNHTYKLNSAAFEFLDDPQTTQQCNYKLQGANATSVTYEFCVNEINATDNAVYSHGGTSTITVMEIAT